MVWPRRRLLIVLIGMMIPMSTKRSNVRPANRRRAASREALLDAAAEVFARDGFHQATLDAIAQRAGLTKGAIYSSFDGKDDLFFALQQRRFADVGDQVASAADQLDAEHHDVATTAASRLPFDRQWNLLFLEFVAYAARRPDFRQALLDRLNDQRQGSAAELERLTSQLNRELRFASGHAARLAGAMVNGLAIEALLDPDIDSQALLADGLSILWQGLVASE